MDDMDDTILRRKPGFFFLLLPPLGVPSFSVGILILIERRKRNTYINIEKAEQNKPNRVSCLMIDMSFSRILVLLYSFSIPVSQLAASRDEILRAGNRPLRSAPGIGAETKKFLEQALRR